MFNITDLSKLFCSCQHVQCGANLEERQHYRLCVLIALRCAQQDLPTGIAHSKRLVF